MNDSRFALPRVPAPREGMRQKRCTLGRPPAHGDLPMGSQKCGGVTILRVADHLDETMFLALDAAMALATEDGGYAASDLRDCCCCDSSALIALLERKKRFGHRLQIVLAMDGRLHRTFNVTGTLPKLDVCYSIDEVVHRRHVALAG